MFLSAYWCYSLLLWGREWSIVMSMSVWIPVFTKCFVCYVWAWLSLGPHLAAWWYVNILNGFVFDVMFAPLHIMAGDRQRKKDVYSRESHGGGIWHCTSKDPTWGSAGPATSLVLGRSCDPCSARIALASSHCQDRVQTLSARSQGSGHHPLKYIARSALHVSTRGNFTRGQNWKSENVRFLYQHCVCGTN